jgi:pimeloyl-ACP methyl ester carboxylesterase
MQSEATSREFGELFPNSHVTVIPGASHFVFNDKPAEFAAAVRGFVDPLEPR